MIRPGKRPRVVIVGAGFGGVRCATGLKDEAVDVTLIDRNNYHLFQPLLYQVATAGLSPADIAFPIRGSFSRQSRRPRAEGDRDGRRRGAAHGHG